MSSSPTRSSFREAIITAAERLERPAKRRRKNPTSKPHRVGRKVKKDQNSITKSETATDVQEVNESDVELCRQSKEEQSVTRGSSLDLSTQTIDRLDAFRFQPRQQATIQTINSGDSRKHENTAQLIHEPTSADTIVPDQASAANESEKLSLLRDSERPIEATLLVEHDSRGQSSILGQNNGFDGSCKTRLLRHSKTTILIRHLTRKLSLPLQTILISQLRTMWMTRTSYTAITLIMNLTLLTLISAAILSSLRILTARMKSTVNLPLEGFYLALHQSNQPKLTTSAIK